MRKCRFFSIVLSLLMLVSFLSFLSAAEMNESKITVKNNNWSSVYTQRVLYFDGAKGYYNDGTERANMTINSWVDTVTIQEGSDGYGVSLAPSKYGIDNWGIQIPCDAGVGRFDENNSAPTNYISVRYRVVNGSAADTNNKFYFRSDTGDWQSAYMEMELVTDGNWHVVTKQNPAKDRNFKNAEHPFWFMLPKISQGTIEIDYAGFFANEEAAEAEATKRAIATNSLVNFKGVQSMKDETSASVRFVGTVNELSGTYNEVGFLLTANGGERKVVKATLAYESILADSNKITAEQLGNKYIYTYVVRGIDLNSEAITFTVTAYAKMGDTTVYGSTYQFKYDPATDSINAVNP